MVAADRYAHSALLVWRDESNRAADLYEASVSSPSTQRSERQ